MYNFGSFANYNYRGYEPRRPLSPDDLDYLADELERRAATARASALRRPLHRHYGVPTNREASLPELSLYQTYDRPQYESNPFFNAKASAYAGHPFYEDPGYPPFPEPHYPALVEDDGYGSRFLPHYVSFSRNDPVTYHPPCPIHQHPRFQPPKLGNIPSSQPPRRHHGDFPTERAVKFLSEHSPKHVHSRSPELSPEQRARDVREAQILAARQRSRHKHENVAQSRIGVVPGFWSSGDSKDESLSAHHAAFRPNATVLRKPLPTTPPKDDFDWNGLASAFHAFLVDLASGKASEDPNRMSGSVPSRSTSARGSKPRHADGRFVTPHPKQSFELPSTLGQSSSTLHRVPSTASPRSNTQETRSNATSIEAQEIMEAIRRSLDSSYDVKPLNAAVATKTREKGELNSEFPRAPAATGSPPSPAPIRIPVRSRSSSPSKSPSPIESIQAIEQELVNLEYDFTFPTTLDFLPPASLGSTPSLAYTTNNLPLRTYENKLSSLLARLDGVESEGSEDVRYARRDLVKRIEKILDDLEEKTKGLWGVLAKKDAVVVENNDETPVEQTETEVSAEPTAGETEGIAVPTAQIIQLVDATTITVDAQEEVEGSTSHPVEVEENGNPSSTSDAIFDQTEDDNIAPEVDVNDMVKPIEPQLEVVVPQAQKSSDPVIYPPVPPSYAPSSPPPDYPVTVETERVEARSPEPHLSSSSSESSLIQVPSDLEEEEGISDLGDESRNPDGALRDGDDDAAADGADDAAPPSMEESEMIEQTTDFVLL